MQYQRSLWPYLAQQSFVLFSYLIMIPVPFSNLPDQPLNRMTCYMFFQYFKWSIRIDNYISIDLHPLKFNHELQSIVEGGLDYLRILLNAFDELSQ